MLEQKDKNEGIRLNRYLGNSGVCTRREADKLIAKGLVHVNGEVVTEMGYRVMPGQKVTYLGETLSVEAKQYILVNKPKECLSTKHKKRGVLSLHGIIEFACYEELEVVQPLAVNTTGIVVMTNDQEVIKKLENNKEELFHVFLTEEVKEADIEKMRKGVKTKLGKIKPVEVKYANEKMRNELGITVRLQKDETIKAMVEQMGYKVERLDRVMFAGITKKNLPRGKWRSLSRKEVSFLKMQ